MERARFFWLLHLARAFKAVGYGVEKRFTMLWWFRDGFAEGYKANK